MQDQTSDNAYSTEDPAEACSQLAAREQDPRFRLDPWRLPRRLEIDLPPELAAKLDALAARSGRDLQDLIVEALDRKIGRPNNR